MKNPFKDNKKFLQSEYNKSLSQRIREARQGQGKRGVVSTALFILWLIAVKKGYGAEALLLILTYIIYLYVVRFRYFYNTGEYPQAWKIVGVNYYSKKVGIGLIAITFLFVLLAWVYALVLLMTGTFYDYFDR